jgi:diadenylate cyclase
MLAFRWQSVFDFLVLVAAIYLVLRWGKQARAFRFSLVIVALKAGALLARQLDLTITSLLLDAADLIAVILLLIVYQAELRHAVTRLDVLAWLMPQREVTLKPEVDEISSAAFALAASQCGALIVIRRRDSLDDLIDGGVKLGGEISAEILEAIFRKKSPVHDGATIIEGDHIASVGGILPLTRRTDVPKDYGTRHRAAMGLAERSDALITVVSEERSEVTLMYGQRSEKMDSAAALAARIGELQTDLQVKPGERSREIFTQNLGLKAAALGLAAIFWSISFFLIGNSIRTVTVPVEFNNVPADMEIARTSTNTVQVQVRGSAWLLDSSSLDSLIARFDLTDSKEGSQTLAVGQSSLSLPPGLVIEKLSPSKISVSLVRTAQP